MALSKKLQEELNKQINFELYSAYLYAAMAADMKAKNLVGIAAWLRQQAHEELLHAMRFSEFVLDRDGRVRMAALKAPPAEWDSPLAAFSAAFEHEQSVTRRLGELLEIAVGEKDAATQNIVRFFIDEQVEEEASLNEVVHQLKLVGSDGAGVYLIDRQLAARPAPAPLGKP